MKTAQTLVLLTLLANTASSASDEGVRSIDNKFDRIDANGDGALAREEFAAVKDLNKPAGGMPAMTRPEIDQVMVEHVLKWVSR